MDRLIHVSKGFIPIWGPQGPLLHAENFVVGWLVGVSVCKPILVIDLGLCPSSGRLTKYYQAQPKPQLKLQLSWSEFALFPLSPTDHPTTHPPQESLLL